LAPERAFNPIAPGRQARVVPMGTGKGAAEALDCRAKATLP
jgi:hypothetical protein